MSDTSTNSAAYHAKTPVSVLADNMMRRVLRISDPGNAQEVAQGLSRAYPTETTELNEEIRGLPIGIPAQTMITTATASIASRELAQAQNNIQRDLDFLTGSSQLKEVEVELEGWGETIRTWLADGAAAATQALDAAARDRVFSARRYLLDYAWVSRLVGSQTPGLSIAYRRFARSLDEAAGLLLVSAGETLSQNNYSGDRLLLQAPASELGSRADAAVGALRNLLGATQDSFSPSAWPWGLDAYRRLMERLEKAGHGDIRVLLQENGLRAFTDELVDLASNNTADGLRRLAATHVVALERADRLIMVATDFARESPPMAALLSALQLFVDTFRGGYSTRLISLGRPLLSSAGLFTFGGLDPGTTALQSLVQARAIVAQLNDVLFGVELRVGPAETQFIVDSCLYAIDIAIDLYSVGMNPLGEGAVEQRAAAYGLFMWELLNSDQGLPVLMGPGFRPYMQTTAAWPPSPAIPSPYLLVSTLIGAINTLGLSGLDRQILKNVPTNAPPSSSGLPTPSLAPSALPHDLKTIGQELALIESRHTGLLPLVYALTPGNYDPTHITQIVKQSLRASEAVVGGQLYRRLDVPPPVETALAKGIKTALPPGTPTVIAVSPSSAPASGGTTITLTGSGFTRDAQVMFDSTAGLNLRVESDTTLRVTTPPGVGGVGLIVHTQAGPSATFTFEFVPEVTGVLPSGGWTTGNTLVNITGCGFTKPGGLNQLGVADVLDVYFDGIPLPAGQVVFVSATQIVATSTVGAPGIVDVQVQTLGGISGVNRPSTQFTYSAQPTGLTVSPSSGPASTLVTITATSGDLSSVTHVKFGGPHATQLIMVSATEICAMSPAKKGSVTPVQVVLETPFGDLSAGPYTYT
jgi:IPT/TIG domain